MRVYEITVFDNNWNLLHKDYYDLEDNQAAEIKAQAVAADFDSDRYEWKRVR